MRCSDATSKKTRAVFDLTWVVPKRVFLLKFKIIIKYLFFSDKISEKISLSIIPFSQLFFQFANFIPPRIPSQVQTPLKTPPFRRARSHLRFHAVRMGQPNNLQQARNGVLLHFPPSSTNNHFPHRNYDTERGGPNRSDRAENRKPRKTGHQRIPRALEARHALDLSCDLHRFGRLVDRRVRWKSWFYWCTGERDRAAYRVVFVFWVK